MLFWRRNAQSRCDIYRLLLHAKWPRDKAYITQHREGSYRPSLYLIKTLQSYVVSIDLLTPHYSLTHNLTLTCKSTFYDNLCNFITRMLFKESYWHFFVLSEHWRYFYWYFFYFLSVLHCGLSLHNKPTWWWWWCRRYSRVSIAIIRLCDSVCLHVCLSAR